MHGCPGSAFNTLLVLQFFNQALSTKISGRILKAAREQQAEIDSENVATAVAARLGTASGPGSAAALVASRLSSLSHGIRHLGARARGGGTDADDFTSMDGDDDGGNDAEQDAALDAELRAHTLTDLDGGGTVGDESTDVLTAEDEAALASFMAPGAASYAQPSLGDIVLSKLRQRQADTGLQVLAECVNRLLHAGCALAITRCPYRRVVADCLSHRWPGRVTCKQGWRRANTGWAG
jgi:essential nuclear protein 1